MARKKKTDSAKSLNRLAATRLSADDKLKLAAPNNSSPASETKLIGRVLSRKDFLALDEAIDHWLDQLRENPTDEQKVRHLLVPLLVEVGRDEEATALLNQFAHDFNAHMLYSRALLNFKQFGPCPMSNSALENAVKQNPSVLDYICGADMPSVDTESFEPGSKEEAVIYLEAGMDGWFSADGAVMWLADYLLEELSRFNHFMDFSSPKVEGNKPSNANVMDFNP